MKISITVGGTFRIGDGEFVKPSITYTDIDLDKDVSKQLEEAKDPTREISKVIMDRLLADIINTLDGK